MSYMALISVIIHVLGCSFESKLIRFKQPIKKSMHRTCVQVSRLFACIPVKIAIVLAKP